MTGGEFSSLSQTARTTLVFADALRTGYIDSQRIKGIYGARKRTYFIGSKEKRQEGKEKSKKDVNVQYKTKSRAYTTKCEKGKRPETKLEFQR